MRSQFCQVAADADGGQLARVIQKVYEDKAVREIMRERVRPQRMGAGKLDDQLQKVREERMWFAALHVETVEDELKAHKAGYHDDRSTYLRPLQEPTSPSSITDKLLPLSPKRTATKMLPDGMPSSSLSPHTRSAGALRRVFSVGKATPGERSPPKNRPHGRNVAAIISPTKGRPRGGGGGGEANNPRAGDNKFLLDKAWNSEVIGRSISQPMRRGPPVSYFEPGLPPVV